MKRLLATAAAATFLALLFTNCKKEDVILLTPDRSPGSIEFVYEDINLADRETPKKDLKMSRPGIDIADPLPVFSIDIRKFACFSGGETVEVYAIGFEKDFLTKGRFKIEWNVDGEHLGNAPRLECIEGKLAEATVIFLPTGQKFRAKARLTTKPAGADR